MVLDFGTLGIFDIANDVLYMNSEGFSFWEDLLSPSPLSSGKLFLLSLSRIFLQFSLKPVSPTMVEENFQIYGVQITGKCICKSKN